MAAVTPTNAVSRLTRRRKWLRRLLVAGGGSLLLLLVFGLAAYWYVARDLPSVETLDQPPAQSTRIYDRDGRLLYQIGAEGRQRVVIPFAQMPANLRHATIAAEDADFYNNPGYDAGALVRALWQNLSSGEVVSGGSTITQQLARTALLTDQERVERSYYRKAREVVLAARITSRYSKDEILALYLNHVYYGNLAYGVEAAARAYFGKSVGDLDLAEAALLAGLPQSPTTYNPLTNPSAARARQKIVLNLMVKRGYLNQAQADTAATEGIGYVSNRYPIQAPHFVMYVRDLLVAQYGREMVEQGGLKVYTTLSLPLQEQTQAIVQAHLATLRDKHVTNAAVVVTEPASGQILAMLGSADYFDKAIDGEVNVALAPRQPGSSIKPLIYAAALINGLTPATLLPDIKTTYADKDGSLYMPRNYDGQWHGPVILRKALANSYNVASVALLDKVGVKEAASVARELGLTTLDADKLGLSLTLGGGEVRLLDMVAAYAVLRNGGNYLAPVAILRVEGADGKLLAEFKGATPRPVLGPNGPQASYQLTSILSDDAARIPAFGRDSILSLGRRPAAVKTGTTTDYHDNWTLGYTTDYVVGVWAGNSDNSAMRDSSGVTGAAPIWHEVIVAASKNQPISQFVPPPGLRRIELCTLSGLLPTRYCTERVSEWFIAGSEPHLTDNFYQGLKIDRRNGLRATSQTPPTEVVEKIFIQLPPEYNDWAQEQGWARPPTASSPLGTVAGAGKADNTAVITSPQEGQYVGGLVVVKGLLPAGATDAGLYVGRAGAEEVSDPLPLASTAEQQAGTLARWETTGQGGQLALRLRYRLKGESFSETISVAVDSLPPRAGIIYPSDAAEFSIKANEGLAEPFTADAADNYAVAQVQFYADGSLLGVVEGDGPYSLPVSLAHLGVGSHSLRVTVLDKAGNQQQSRLVNITVAP